MRLNAGISPAADPGTSSTRSFLRSLNHFAESAEDFTRRISQLTDEELTYITEKILTGEEGLGCVETEDAEALVKLVHDRISPEMAKKVIAAYESGGECDL